ncbi:hypothetical protein [Rivibacter subsaxonicus]|uniref:hypothetical protein n=1 Tax=Rivibacter subsaxonicus TaxID=457575 RepID=UPI0013EEC3B2|nr:hypothetical protein [Rivibacter subsaxonicus]
MSPTLPRIAAARPAPSVLQPTLRRPVLVSAAPARGQLCLPFGPLPTGPHKLRTG